MYLCYVDETGMDDDSDVVVTVGICTACITNLRVSWGIRSLECRGV